MGLHRTQSVPTLGGCSYAEGLRAEAAAPVESRPRRRPTVELPAPGSPSPLDPAHGPFPTSTSNRRFDGPKLFRPGMRLPSLTMTPASGCPSVCDDRESCATSPCAQDSDRPRRRVRAKTAKAEIKAFAGGAAEAWVDMDCVSRRRRRSKTSVSAVSAATADEVETPSNESHLSVCSPVPSCAESLEGLNADTPKCLARWRRGALLGHGSYGTVYKAQDADSGLIFAVKMTPIQESGKDDVKYMEKLTVEIDICSSLRHPNIVSYLGHQRIDGSMCIFLEYVPGGSMASILSEFGPVTGKLLQSATRGALEGLSYLHSREPPVVHRDIKGANLLVDTDFCVKLADFGCSKQQRETMSFTTIGSVPWMAPEVIANERGHGRKADIWSLACTVLEMATAQKPWGDAFFGNNVMFALNHIGLSGAVPDIPVDLCEECQDFLRCCLKRAPEERARAKELLPHRWFLLAKVAAIGGA